MSPEDYYRWWRGKGSSHHHALTMTLKNYKPTRAMVASLNEINERETFDMEKS